MWHWWPVLLGPLVLKYRRVHGRWPRLLRPQRFTEKVLRRMLFDRRPLLPHLAGKLESRDYARAILGEGVLVPLLAVITEPADLLTCPLPGQFFMKANHGSGMNHAHRGPAAPDRAALVALATGWMANDAAKWGREWVYRDVRRAVLIEPLLDGADGHPPPDYKLFCYDGRVHFITVIGQRFTATQGHILDREWRHIEGHIYFAASALPPPPRPGPLDAMIAAAEALSREIAFLRVDFYLIDGAIKLSELTTTPGGASERFTPPALDLVFGAPWR